ncbi:hypothetical protein BHE74_00024275 [Ensete ventricosum]|nr:hypothetical protein BHE74_00024275 [Ensete ventricosum]
MYRLITNDTYRSDRILKKRENKKREKRESFPSSLHNSLGRRDEVTLRLPAGERGDTSSPGARRENEATHCLPTGERDDASSPRAGRRENKREREREIGSGEDVEQLLSSPAAPNWSEYSVCVSSHFLIPPWIPYAGSDLWIAGSDIISIVLAASDQTAIVCEFRRHIRDWP